MKTFKEFVAESHSYGMEPPVGDYMKGLADSDTREAKEAGRLRKAYKHMKGNFGEPKTEHGVTQEHGSGEYDGYHVRRSEPKIPESYSLHHEGSDGLSKITRTNQGYRVNHKISGGSGYSQARSFHKNKNAAIHHAIAHHKDKVFNSY